MFSLLHHNIIEHSIVVIAVNLTKFLETNVVNFLAEAATAQIHVIFADNTMTVGTLDAAARAGTHRFGVRVPDLLQETESR